MYPAHGLQLFPPFPRDERVFVAMSFDERLRSRWERVIEPGIKSAGLGAFRVDIPKTSTSIPADIIRGIAQSRLVFGDVTVLDGHRNANVLYEIGIAHASRQPEEVLLFRSDNAPLLFDVSTIRVNLYDPGGREDEARGRVTEAVQAALREVDVVRAVTVERAAGALDVPSVEILMSIVGRGSGSHPPMKTMGDALGRARHVAAIDGLLQRGLIVAESEPLDAEEWTRLRSVKTSDFLQERVSYRPTPFGRAVMTAVARRWGVPGGPEDDEAPVPK
jgi:hypothetical protein